MSEKKSDKSAVTYKMIAEALFDNYECIYDIHMETMAYKTYYQSDSYRELQLAKKGDNFFEALPKAIERIIAPEDREYISQMLSKDALTAGIAKNKYYRIVYRIQNGDQKIYHQLRATFQDTEDGMHILMGVKNIDDLMRRKIAYEKEVEAMQQKEHNHLEAVLASAAAYLEANLSQNVILEKQVGHQDETYRQIREMPDVSEIPAYDDMQQWIGDNLVAVNRKRYMLVSSRQYLTACFQRGDKRASVSFSLYAKNGEIQPCKAVFYLYREKMSGDLYVFCVIYDLTEQQRQEKEMTELENALTMSRIRNSTSQMKPHFLYNALGSIQELILINPRYASNLLGDFIVHLRSCVRAMADDKLIPFSEEFENINAYVNIEKMRLGDKLEVVYDIPVTDFNIIPLCIQPLVENAIRHGIHGRGSKGGCLTLRTNCETDAWVIQVEDNGIGFDPGQTFSEEEQEKNESTGLKNIRFRLDKVMNGSMEIQSTKGVGTTVTVRIPREEKKNENNLC